MKTVKDKIDSLIKKLDSETLRDKTLKGVFTNFLKYIEKNIDQVKHDFKTDIYIKNNYVDIYSFLKKKESERIIIKSNGILCDYFFKIDNEKIENLIDKEVDIKLTLSNKKEINTKAKLEMNKDFIQKEEVFFALYRNNNIKWKTIFAPFSRKVLTLKMLEVSDDILDKKIIDIKIENNIIEDNYGNRFYVPSFNFEKKMFELNHGNRPNKKSYNNKNYYEYKLKKTNDYKKILVDWSNNFNLIQIREDKEECYIILDKQIESSFDYYELNNIDVEEYKFIVSNKLLDNTALKYKSSLLPVIKTKFELDNIVNSFSIVKDYGIFLNKVKVEEFNNIEYENNKNNKIKNYNWFIKDDFNIPVKNLVLEFSAKKKDYLIQNIIDFLVSEIQLYFREFYVKGVLID